MRGMWNDYNLCVLHNSFRDGAGWGEAMPCNRVWTQSNLIHSLERQSKSDYCRLITEVVASTYCNGGKEEINEKKPVSVCAPPGRVLGRWKLAAERPTKASSEMQSWNEHLARMGDFWYFHLGGELKKKKKAQNPEQKFSHSILQLLLPDSVRIQK